MFLIGDAVGIQAAATELSTGITAQALWDSINPFLPTIVVLILFSFGYSFFRRMTKRASKGRP